MLIKSVQTGPGHYILDGDLNATTLSVDWAVSKAKQNLLLPSDNALNLDLSKVAEVDSAGLAWLINMTRDCRTQNVQLSLSNVPKSLLKLAKISDVEHFLPLQ